MADPTGLRLTPGVPAADFDPPHVRNVEKRRGVARVVVLLDDRAVMDR